MLELVPGMGLSAFAAPPGGTVEPSQSVNDELMRFLEIEYGTKQAHRDALGLDSI